MPTVHTGCIMMKELFWLFVKGLFLFVSLIKKKLQHRNKHIAAPSLCLRWVQRSVHTLQIFYLYGIWERIQILMSRWILLQKVQSKFSCLQAAGDFAAVRF